MADADAAVAIVHARDGADSVLVMRRAERETDPWSGHWSFPGGRREPDDGGPLHTALRELEEECGIRLGRDRLECALALATARRKAGPFLRVAPFVFGVEAELPVALDPQEAVDSTWVPLNVLRDPARHALRPVPGLPPDARFPAIDLKGMPLWGFTYRLITDWLRLNPPADALRESSFQAARALLDDLAAHGCALKQDWVDRGGGKAAAVVGPIPAEMVWAAISKPGTHIPRVNMVEARPDCVHIVGLEFEEYFILTRPDLQG